MRIFDLIGMCVRNLLRRKFRTLLTIIGVIIGTCAIVVTISLGVGINASQEAFLNEFGDLTVIEVYSRGGDDVLLNDDMIDTFKAMPEVQAVTTYMRYRPETGNMMLYQGKKERYEYWYTVAGVDTEALELLGYTLQEGEMPKPGGKKIQLLFGTYAAYEFANAKSGVWIDYYGYGEDEMPEPYFQPLESDFHFTISSYGDGGKVTKYQYEAEAVGILSKDVSDYEATFMIYMHIDDMKQLRADYEKEAGIKVDKSEREKEQYDYVKVKAHELKDVANLEATLEAYGFYTWSLEAYRQSMEEQTQQIQMILGMLGGVSLFVAAISITNTMIMSVYERTREIGVMKVLGCLVRDVRSVFLMEAGLIGFFGGILGVGTSYLLSYLLNTFGGSIGSALGGFAMEGASVSIIPPWLAVLGLAFASVIGLVSGFTPANRAVKISALEAIKTE